MENGLGQPPNLFNGATNNRTDERTPAALHHAIPPHTPAPSQAHFLYLPHTYSTPYMFPPAHANQNFGVPPLRQPSMETQEPKVPSLLDSLYENIGSATPLQGDLRAHDHYYIDDNGVRTSPRSPSKSKSIARDGMTSPTPAKAQGGTGRGRGRGRGIRNRGRGRGSHSGANARKAGNSDTEIEALPEEEKKAAELVLPKKRLYWNAEMTEKLVQYLVAPEQWEKVPMQLKSICTEVSSV